MDSYDEDEIERLIHTLCSVKNVGLFIAEDLSSFSLKLRVVNLICEGFFLGTKFSNLIY